MSVAGDMTVSEHIGQRTLPAGCDALFEAGARRSFFLSRHWFQLVLTHGMAPAEVARFLVAQQNGEATALLALKMSGSAISGLTTPYTCLFAPLLARSDAVAALLRALRRSAMIRLDALDSAAVPNLVDAAVAAGWRVRRFDHFGNWYEAVAGVSWPGYLARRPGNLRSTVRRKLGRMERDGGGLEVVLGNDGLEPAIAAYEAVYARSWKPAEPFADFNAALMRTLAPLGKLRLGIYRLAGTPVAAQLWLVEDGRASVLKLAHDDAYRDASPGTVLTALMLRRLLEDERVTEIDFGRGDDDYKKLWASERRQMSGILLLNPWRPRGLAALARHGAGALLRRMLNRGG